MRHYFDKIPYRPRVKRKELFVRRVSAGAWKNNAQALHIAMDKEIEALDRERSLINIDWDQSHADEAAELDIAARKQKVMFAQSILNGLSSTTALPRTWHGLFNINKEANK